ncbi:class D sortase [Bacillus sp. AK031]
MRRRKSGRAMLSRIAPTFFSIILIVSGVLFAGYHAYGYAKGYFAVDSADITIDEGKLQQTSNEAFSKEEKNESNVSPEEKALYQQAPAKGEKIGKLLIPKLDISMPIYEGADEKVLEKGVGHFSGSVLPGMQDNAVLSGHRDTVFRDLGQIGEKNFLIVKTSAGKFTYRVNQVRIVDADDRTVIVPKEEATLTVTTCYPFDYIGHAPKRYVLVAELVNKKVN